MMIFPSMENPKLICFLQACALAALGHVSASRPEAEQHSMSLASVTQSFAAESLIGEDEWEDIIFDLLDRDFSGTVDEKEWGGQETIFKQAWSIDDGGTFEKGKSYGKRQFKKIFDVFSEQHHEFHDGGYRMLKNNRFVGDGRGDHVVDLFTFWDGDGDGSITSKEFAIRNAALSDLDGGYVIKDNELIHLNANLIRFPFMAGSDGLLSRDEVEKGASTLVGSVADYVFYDEQFPPPP